MFNFDAERFLRIQDGAVAQAQALRPHIAGLVENGAQNIFLLGTGGAAILMEPAADLLRKHSAFPVFTEFTAELNIDGSVHLGGQSIVVIPSLSGTTKESIELLETAQKAGAHVIVLTGHANTPLAQKADKAFVNFAEDDTSCESFYIQSYAIAHAIMAARGELENAQALYQELDQLPQVLLSVKQQFESEAAQIATHIQNMDYHIIAGAGNTWPEAHYYGMCILEEMQWIRTRPVHASHFFHGTLELLEKDVSVLLYKGEDAYRPLVERVENFAKQYTNELIIFDTAKFDMGDLSPTARAYASPIALATMMERMSAHLESLRNHPLTTRRYYKRVAY
jgi:fructoselysine-6-phosphate deglycase